MCTQRLSRLFSFALLAGSMTIILLGGCPVAQQPTTPTDEQEQLEPPAAPDLDDDQDRPITPPDIDDDTDDDDSGGDIVDGGGDGDGGGTGDDDGTDDGSGSVALNVDGPSADVLVRPGTLVELLFNIFDPQGAMTGVDLVVARDADADNEPDGTPEFTQAIPFAVGINSYNFDTIKIQGLLQNSFGRFLLGVRYATVDGTAKLAYARGSLSIDSQIPGGEWIAPAQDLLMSKGAWVQIRVSATDNRPMTVKVRLDPDTIPDNGNEWTLINDTELPAGTSELNQWVQLSGFPSSTYYYYVTITDGIEPVASFYGAAAGAVRKLAITNRLIGSFDLNQLTNSGNGAILQGFNFNDLAGSSMSSVPDLTGDGRDELIIGSRFGKAYIIQNNGVGFGEAYMIYGSGGRLRGIQRLNSVGQTISGLVFPGIRTPRRRGTDAGGIFDPLDSTRWTAGLSDITVVDDMDGDDLAELVFSFPRVESINLGETDPSVQHPELAPDLRNMGNLEYNSFYLEGMIMLWHKNEAQFTRGGVVVVSSHNEILRNPNRLNRKSNRVFDLHEAGQLFNSMSRPGLVPYIRRALTRPQVDGEPFLVCADCDLEPPDGCEEGDYGDDGMPGGDDDTPGNCGDDGCNEPPTETGLLDGREQLIQRWLIQWDVILNNQGPGGFHQYFSIPPADPPLASPSGFPYTALYPFPFGFYPNHWVLDGDACFVAEGCEVTNEWVSWFPTLPCTTLGGTPTWAEGGNPIQDPLVDCYPDNPCVTIVDPEDGPCPDAEPPCSNPDVTPSAGGVTAWTGFYGPPSTPRFTVDTGESFPAPVGARVLGQAVEDQFGMTVASDGTWLYITAPERTVNESPYGDDVPSLPGPRSNSGVVYQLRTHAPTNPGGPTRTQLWIEPDQTWPTADAEDTGRRDYTMPVPHQYIIESVGSLRGNPEIGIIDTAFAGGGDDGCPPPHDPGVDQPDASACYAYTPYPVGTSGYYMDRTPQIVGPHVGAKIAFVRALGDLNDDGVRDFAVGSDQVKDPVTGEVVGAIFIIFGRPTGLEGDYLLEHLYLAPTDPERLHGVMLKGASAGEKLARVFDDAGDFNGDGIPDVIVGNEGAAGDTGEAIVLFGSSTIESPENGWTVDDIVAAGRAVRFVGGSAGDLAGANVAGAGDVDQDGYADILIAAPGAQEGKGAVYLVYGSPSLGGDVNLANAGTFDLPGVRFIGRSAGDALGGGMKTVEKTDPNAGSTTAFSCGVVRLGDIDGDGRDDYALSAMLADPISKVDAGEIYILYGRGD